MFINRRSIILNPSKMGALGELVAAAWLMKQGYEVFQNVAASGPADLVAWKPDTGEIHFVDAKMSKRTVLPSGEEELKYYKGEHAKKGIRYLLVCGDFVGWADELE